MSDKQSRINELQSKTLAISCVVPVYNEQGVIQEFLQALQSILANLTAHHEVIVVDDGSQDNTVAHVRGLMTELPVKLLSFSRNFGKEVAITAGLEHASGRVVVILDADFQHPLELINLFLEKWSAGYDMVYGVRQNREDESQVKRVFTRMFYTLMQKMTKTQIPANAGDFRLLDRAVVDAINACDERNRFMKGLYGWVGYTSIGVPYTAAERRAGKSTWRFRSLAELALTGITSFSSIPLRTWGVLGCIISAISLLYALCIVIDTLLFGVDVPGYATIVVAIMFFGGVQLLSIGILGEYIGRIFDEVKRRPKYIIAQKMGFDKNFETTILQERKSE